MPTIFAHAIASAALARAGEGPRATVKLLALAAVSGVVPDLDGIGLRLGIPYDHALGHRGFSHSLTFAAAWAALVVATFLRDQPKKMRLFMVFFAATASHGLFDAMTNGGRGVGFFIPFDTTRYFLPFRPLEVSPLSATRFLDQAPVLFLSELLWVGVPCAALIVVGWLWRSLASRHTEE